MHVSDHVNSAADVYADVRTAVEVVITDVIDNIMATAPDRLISSDDSSKSESVFIEDDYVKPSDVPVEGIQIFCLMHALPSDIFHNAIPSGLKEYSYSIIVNKANVDRQDHGQGYVFEDDCAAWNKDGGRMCVFHYITSANGGLFLSEGQYCVKRNLNRCRMNEPSTLTE